MIVLKGVDFRYRDTQPWVLQDLSLQVPEGAITAVLGPNGTGKTTLLLIMLGLLRPARGLIQINGAPPDEFSRRELSQLIGLVPQFESLPFNFTIREYVLLGRSPYLKPFQVPGPDDLQVAEDALREAGIVHLQDKPVTELSGGERQLSHLARALAQQTPVLLLDEPTAHLDLENQSRILSLLKKLSSGGSTIVFTTHDPNAALYAADRFVLLNQGRVYAEGEAAEVITRGNLSALYNTPVRVERTRGQLVVLMEGGDGTTDHRDHQR